MPESASEYLTTKELADLLRIKERKVYELAASGAVPCSRATGKLLFPRRAIQDWIAAHSSGQAAAGREPRPAVLLGSHDPLLEWVLRESRAGLAQLLDGSLDGLERFLRGEGVAAGLHVCQPAPGAAAELDWNRQLVRQRLGDRPVVLVEFAWRERGLLVPADRQGAYRGIGDLRGRRVVPRQAEAGSQRLLELLLERAGVDPGELQFTTTARSEIDAALAVQEGAAEVGFGLLGVARQYRLGFVPLVRERFDLLVERRDWFEPPLQRLAAFCRSAAFAAKAAELQGYHVEHFGRVHYNGP